MALKFTQHEIERDVAAVLEYGDIAKISNISGIGYSYIDQQLNPNDERKSFIFGFLEIICAIDEISEEKGERVWRSVEQFRELSRGRAKCEVCLNHASGELNREVSEYVSAKISGKPFKEQMKEFLDIEAQITQVKAALLDKYNRLKEVEPDAHGLKVG